MLGRSHGVRRARRGLEAVGGALGLRLPVQEVGEAWRCHVPVRRAVSAASSAVEEAEAPSSNGTVRARPWTVRRGVRAMLQLSKARLTGLVVASAGFGHLALGPPSEWAPLGALLVGTALASASANTWNQVREIEFDAAMSRTRGRPLPSGRVSKTQASLFGAATGLAGVGVLAAGCGPVPALLGAANIGLYSLVYTPLKRVTPWNTEVGSLVGAIPPLMGWAAAGGALTDPAAATLFGLLFLWQMPHFYALAWRHRGDYAKGGYEMISRRDPLGTRTAQRTLAYTAALATLPLAATAAGVTGTMFAVEGSAINAYLLHLARQFHENPTDDTARRLFLATLWYLPLLMALLVFHSAGWRSDAQKQQTDATAAALEDAIRYAESLSASHPSSTSTAPTGPHETGGETGGVDVEAFRARVQQLRAWLRDNACPHEVIVEERVAARHASGEPLAQARADVAEDCPPLHPPALPSTSAAPAKLHQS